MGVSEKHHIIGGFIMKKNLTELVFILDRSGSMAGLEDDCDTRTCIASSIAEGFYSVSKEFRKACRDRLPKPLLDILNRFRQHLPPKTAG